ncbi:hypothetical protein [Paractinoplanes atraurantiacus]|uniref:Uncharacterized protein n=1 Tax=Paractinoplanes atraurantiacus TaxID=1036182 RepID=A0A285IJT4_9ACTN|nr:hypothetical protein [Actinoplanes atraurantiacus]SNY48017.1 hypothetical protein SAMN05421748_108269 [Actinoplanes atraurantiacus]
MSAETWPTTDERLARRYRRLLLAYSGRYRRLHGAEMLTTILEMAEPARSRPSAGEAWHLIGSGVRQRFRLPSGRPFTVVTAVLVTVVLGVFGAAAGSVLGTSAGLPSRSDAQKLVNAAVTDPRASFVYPMSGSGRADSLNFSVSPGVRQPNWTVEDARAGLAADGWTLTEFTVHPRPASITCTADAVPGGACVFESTTATVIAERDGLILRGTATDFLAGESGDAWVGGLSGTLFTERNAAYLPLTAAGALLGALAGWLLTAALAYRLRSLPPGSGRMVAAFIGAAVTTAAAPVWAVVVNAVMFGAHRNDTGPVYALHAALRPSSHLDGVPPWLIPACTVAAAAAAAIALGLLMLGGGREGSPSAAQRT